MLRTSVLLSAFLVSAVAPARAQGWDVAVYPVLGWVPFGIDLNVNVPPFDGGNGTGGDVDIIDSQVDGAFLGGFTASNGRFRIEGDGVWVAFGGDRVDLPELTMDVDVIYGRVTGGYAVAKDFYVTGGVRRLALDYDIQIGNQASFSRKPGIWDPLIGVGWHKQGRKIDWHAVLEGGGFGVGADVDLGAVVRLDWKPVSHFGFTAGYNFLYLKITDELANRTFVARQTLHGPLVGIGFYF
jgi:hypothetical protein